VKNHPNTDATSLDPQIWESIPNVEVDSEQIRQRGRRLRRRRQATTAGASVAALALISAISWTALNGAGPEPQAPATGTDVEQTTGHSEEPPTGSSPTDVPDTSGTDVETGTSDESTNPGEDIEPPRLQESELEALATGAGLRVDRLTTEGNMLDAGLLHPTGAYISITITVATPEEISAALDQATADRPYVSTTIAGHRVRYREPAASGQPAHWLLSSPDGTQMISVDAAPAGAEADHNGLPDSVISIVERDLIPALAEA